MGRIFPSPQPSSSSLQLREHAPSLFASSCPLRASAALRADYKLWRAEPVPHFPLACRAYNSTARLVHDGLGIRYPLPRYHSSFLGNNPQLQTPLFHHPGYRQKYSAKPTVPFPHLPRETSSTCAGRKPKKREKEDRWWGWEWSGGEVG